MHNKVGQPLCYAIFGTAHVYVRSLLGSSLTVVRLRAVLLQEIAPCHYAFPATRSEVVVVLTPPPAMRLMVRK